MAYDNLCKYLAESDPDAFATWILGQPTSGVKVLKTELTLEPIRADSVTFLQTSDRLLHLEFQVSIPKAKEKPLPLRMLNYWVRLYWQYDIPITQVLIWLKPTQNSAAFENEFILENTRHRYEVIRLWEQPSELFLTNQALLPFAPLTANHNPTQLLSQVAQQIAKIDSPQQRAEIASCAEILAGLRYSQTLINRLFREEIMQESVIYQQIIQKGRQQERQERFQGELALLLRQLKRRIGQISESLVNQLQQLSFSQLEDLGEALLDFNTEDDLVNWLTQQGIN